jgi:hypothetical protein
VKYETNRAPFQYATTDATFQELGYWNFVSIEMASSGKTKANKHANGGVATPKVEEAHGYEFLGP